MFSGSFDCSEKSMELALNKKCTKLMTKNNVRFLILVLALTLNGTVFESQNSFKQTILLLVFFTFIYTGCFIEIKKSYLQKRPVLTRQTNYKYN